MNGDESTPRDAQTHGEVLPRAGRTPSAKKVPFEGCSLFPLTRFPDLMVPEGKPLCIRVGLGWDGGTEWFTNKPAETSLTAEALHRRYGPFKYRVALHSLSENGTIAHASYVKQDTFTIAPRGSAELPDPDDDVGMEPWPVDVENLPAEVREEYDRRQHVRAEIAAEIAAEIEQQRAQRGFGRVPAPVQRGGARGGYLPAPAVGGRGPRAGRGQAPQYDGQGGFDDGQGGFDDGQGGFDGYDTPPMPNVRPAQGMLWAFAPEGYWMQVPLAGTKPAEPSLTDVLLRKFLSDGPVVDQDAIDDRAAKRRREAAEWDANQKRIAAEWEASQRRAEVVHAETLATLAMQREKIAAEIRMLSTPPAPVAPQAAPVNVEEIALRAANAVRLEHMQAENRRLQAAANAAQNAAHRPFDPMTELKKRTETTEQLRELARDLGMVDATEEAIAAAGGDSGFNVNTFLNSEAGKVVAERGIGWVLSKFDGPPQQQATVVQHHVALAAPPQQFAAQQPQAFIDPNSDYVDPNAYPPPATESTVH